MSALPTLLAHPSLADLPLHERLVRALRTAILEGHLLLHSRLPASRALAEDLGVSRSTVELAYSRLEAEGYLQRRMGAGTFVALAAQPQPKRAGVAAAGLSLRGQRILDAGLCRDPVGVLETFGSGQGDPRVFPRDIWGSLMQRHWKRQAPRLMSYGDPQGLPELRAAIASYLVQSRGLVCAPEQVLILTSSQQGIQLIAQLLIDAGDRVWLEEPGYLGARSAMLSAGAVVHPVPVDGEGIALAASHPAPRLIYTTPSHQYPLGMVMSLPRRMALLAEAERHNAWILEDDYDGEFQYSAHPLPALQGLDQQGRVIYVGTFSKSLFGSLRLAYLVLPSALVEPFAQARAAFDGHSNQLLQAVTADFIQEGHFAAYLRQVRPLYRSRRDLLWSELARHCPELTPLRADSGLQCAALLPRGGESRWTSSGNALGLGLRPLSGCYLGAESQEGWLLGYAAVGNARLLELCRLLGEVMAR